MMCGRGLRTISALPIASHAQRIPLLGRRLNNVKPRPHKKLTRPVWHIPGFDQLACLVRPRD
jgi:hypothetical protein